MAQRELTPADYLAMLKRHWVLILICTIVGGPLAYGVSRMLPVKYKSQTLVLVEQQSVSQEIVRSVDTVEIGQRLASMQQQILSRSRLEPIIRQYGLYQSDSRKASAEELVGRRHEVDPFQPVDCPLLGVGRRAAGRQDARHPTQRNGGCAAGKLEHATTLGLDHFPSWNCRLVGRFLKLKGAGVPLWGSI